MNLKHEMRVLGVDDSPLVARDVLVVGALFRGAEWLDGVMRTYLTRDGLDATERIAEMMCSSKHHTQMRAVLLDGITYGGFNVVDIHALYESTSVPVIAVMRDFPDLESMHRALQHVSEPEHRYSLILKAGGFTKVITRDETRPLYIQTAGIEPEDGAHIVRRTTLHANIPEPLRVAHMISSAMVLGESSGKA
ncbi:MAG: endonuclease dU [Methermicoccaceae archaeon]